MKKSHLVLLLVALSLGFLLFSCSKEEETTNNNIAIAQWDAAVWDQSNWAE